MIIKTKTVHQVDYSDFDSYVEEVYGQVFEFVAEEEANNYTSKTYQVKKGPLNKWNQEDVDRFKATGSHPRPSAGALLQDMANQDLIPEGDYIIKVYW